MLSSETIKFTQELQQRGIDPILYGSRGVALYLGPFKDFGDTDLLVADNMVQENWQELIQVMKELGYKLVDEHEHEFINDQASSVAFAGISILVRDGIVEPEEDITRVFEVEGVTIRTLKPEIFKRAYEYSAKDGYRKDTRGKKDEQIIELIEDYMLRNPSGTTQTP